jgi:DNA invertase Pin-like site-specific DNA recombinase
MDLKDITQNETQLRAVGYVRISKENPEGHSLEAQRQAIEAYCKARGWELVRIYEDDGVSGAVAPDERPALAELERDVLSDGIQYVIVWRLDRLGRKAGELLAFLDRLEKKGVAFVSIDDAIDTSKPEGRLLRTILAGVAEFERELIRQRTRRGLAIARQKGKYLGRTPKGMVRDAEGRLQDAGRAELIRKLRARVFLHKEPLARAARELGIPYATAWRMLYGHQKKATATANATAKGRQMSIKSVYICKPAV